MHVWVSFALPLPNLLVFQKDNHKKLKKTMYYTRLHNHFWKIIILHYWIIKLTIGRWWCNLTHNFLTQLVPVVSNFKVQYFTPSLVSWVSLWRFSLKWRLARMCLKVYPCTSKLCSKKSNKDIFHYNYCHCHIHDHNEHSCSRFWN